MSKLNIMIDGSWLFRACCADQILSNLTVYPSSRFHLDFNKFNQALLNHAKSFDKNYIEYGSRYIATSIFKLPIDIDDWPNQDHDISEKNILKIKKNIYARKSFVEQAYSSGYLKDAVTEPELKGYILKKIIKKSYSEKQVDTTVVALSIKMAILNKNDSHAIITGDADIIPAIKVAYPEYSDNVFIVTTHPDELKAHHRQSAWSLTDFNFKVSPFYLQDHISDIMCGEHVYSCSKCNSVFETKNPISPKARPYCGKCLATRT